MFILLKDNVLKLNTKNIKTLVTNAFILEFVLQYRQVDRIADFFVLIIRLLKQLLSTKSHKLISQV